jgi:hypothetical protein
MPLAAALASILVALTAFSRHHTRTLHFLYRVSIAIVECINQQLVEFVPC